MAKLLCIYYVFLLSLNPPSTGAGAASSYFISTQAFQESGQDPKSPILATTTKDRRLLGALAVGFHRLQALDDRLDFIHARRVITVFVTQITNHEAKLVVKTTVIMEQVVAFDLNTFALIGLR